MTPRHGPKWFPETLKAILVSEHNRTPEQAEELSHKYFELLLRGIMEGLSLRSVRLVAQAIELEEEKHG
jgi:hypothetical protein